MDGHPRGCGCLLCLPLKRIGTLLSHSPSAAFASYAAGRLRVLECDLRDELDRLASPAVPPSIPPGWLGASPSQPSGDESKEGSGVTPSSGQRAAEGGAGAAFEKGATTPPIEGAPKESPLREVKEEVSPAKGGGPVVEPPQSSEEEGEKKTPKAKGEERRQEEKASKEGREVASPKRKKKRRTEGESEEGEEERREEKSPKRRKEKAERSRKRRKEKEGSEESKKVSLPASSSKGVVGGESKEARPRGDSRSPSGKGKEKKSRPERPPEPANPPIRREGSVAGTKHVPKAAGRGWIGPIPYSNHPRWNRERKKGITKVIKQEYYSRRHRDRDYWK